MASEDQGELPSAPPIQPEVLVREQSLQDICKAFLFQLGLCDETETKWFYDTRDDEPYHGRIRLAIGPGQTAELLWQSPDDDEDDEDDVSPPAAFSRQELREAVEEAWPKSLYDFSAWGQDGVERSLVEVAAASGDGGDEQRFPEVVPVMWAELGDKLRKEEIVWHGWCLDTVRAAPGIWQVGVWPHLLRVVVAVMLTWPRFPKITPRIRDIELPVQTWT